MLNCPGEKAFLYIQSEPLLFHLTLTVSCSPTTWRAWLYPHDNLLIGIRKQLLYALIRGATVGFKINF